MALAEWDHMHILAQPRKKLCIIIGGRWSVPIAFGL